MKAPTTTVPYKWTLRTVPTSCGLCHQIGPFPSKGDKETYACVYVDYPSNGPVEAELLGNAVMMTAAKKMSNALVNVLLWHHMMGLPEHPVIKEAKEALLAAGYTQD